MNHRRLTPSMSLLLAFEAAARHESYTRAAEELSLTQSAVGRQVQALEQLLGLTLFRREGRQIVLTDVGRAYSRELGLALGQIRSATLQAMAFASGQGTLRLAVLPTFGSKWLLPRLGDFYAAHPGMLVHLHSRIQAVDFAASEIDAAISVGSGDWPGLRAHPLQAEHLVVIASPATLAELPDATPATLADQLLLGVANNPQAWGEWFRHHELPHRAMRPGPSFELTSHLIQAVRAGIGIGLVPRVLVEDELAQGELLACGPALVSRRSYYLVYPPRNEGLPSLQAFRQWLLAEINEGEGQP
ncbi:MULTISPECIES: LysR substrate-binding domain-containing protein [Pseudomonadaceae]|jgi:DNA-binding transcriptional LysR family regulator|uniref:DNA-binding transcriptional regulator, LysR family n=2 Tax=Pseudomonas TaxID=286 RepID=A0A1G5PCG4_9PSED|nr:MULTISPECIES: LysR substrate-binding domain-containing protein [Pseudomonas]HCV76981.1 LysR family transcriptional regulator [Pseudomonas sp.]KIZ49059.1 LysR family transcriptional regulator [Pseudomonas oryzihabitans]KTT52512.1 LysR family transcriptional regulator [Pseudomonas psychrotolerans]MBA1261064.1 LysR family transcriptional regulator [Pseudomonas psychrotolerans]MBH3328238.1 LysR family transcriptional regulator [Pseudomonas oryzihabitans]